MSKKQIKKQVPVDPPPNLVALSKIKRALAMMIAVFAFLLYAQSIGHKYTLDDGPVIHKNRITQQGVAGIPTLLKTDYWYGSENDELRGPVYRPTSMIIFAIVWEFSPNSPHIYHFINVLLYAVSCLLLFLVLCKLFKSQNLIFPFVCSILYTAHPIHTEVVNNIKSLDEILCFLFGLASIWFTLRYISTRSIVSLVLAGISFFLALISKETGITFLVIIPLIIFFFADSPGKKIVRVSVLLLSLTGIWLLVRMMIFKDLTQHVGVSGSILNNTLNAAPDFISRQATAFYILVRYIGLLIFPHPLTCDYNFAQIEIKTFSDPAALFGLILYSVSAIYAFINFRKKSIIAFGILFYLITLAPVSNIFFIGGSSMAERFMYMPSFGFCIILTHFLIRLTKTEKIKSGFSSLSKFFSLNKLLFTIVLIIISLYSLKVFTRNGDWKDNITIFSHDVNISENSASAHFILGTSLLYDVYPHEKDPLVQDSLLNVIIAELNRGTEILSRATTKAPIYNYHLGIAYLNRQDFNNAMVNLEVYRSKYIDPNKEVYNKLGIAYYNLKMYDRSLEVSDSVIKYFPSYFDGYYQKANALAGKQDYANAIVHYQKAIELHPTNAELFYNRGIAFGNEKKYEEALNDYQKAIELNPAYVEAYVNRGNILTDAGRYDEAITNFNKAIEIRPGFDKSYFNRGVIYINLKRYTEAISDFTKAIDLNPGYVKAYYNRGIAKFNASDKAGACTDIKKAAELGFPLAADFYRQHCQ